MANQRVLQGVAATLTVTFVDQNGKAADAVGAVTVGVTRADGTVLKAAGTATTHGATGVYNVALTAAENTQLDTLTATWKDGVTTRATTYHDVVGGYYVSIGELREPANLSDATKFPDAKLIEARNWFETRFEGHTGRAFVPRARRLTLISSGAGSLELADTDLRSVTSLTIDGTALAGDVLTALQFNGATVTPNRLTSSINATWSEAAPFGYRGSALVVAYTYGWDSPPYDVREAALIAIRTKVLTDKNANVGRPMLSVADGSGGTTRYLMPDENRPFGDPDVDAVANAWRRKDSLFASVPLGCG